MIILETMAFKKKASFAVNHAGLRAVDDMEKNSMFLAIFRAIKNLSVIVVVGGQFDQQKGFYVYVW